MNKILKIGCYIVIEVLLFLLITLYVIKVPEQKNITWGVNVSQAHATFLKLDFKKFYIDILQDLQVTHIKLITNWDWVEVERGVFSFDDID